MGQGAALMSVDFFICCSWGVGKMPCLKWKITIEGMHTHEMVVPLPLFFKKQ